MKAQQRRREALLSVINYGRKVALLGISSGRDFLDMRSPWMLSSPSPPSSPPQLTPITADTGLLYIFRWFKPALDSHLAIAFFAGWVGFEYRVDRTCRSGR